MSESTRYPVLAKSDRMFYPEDGLCPVCKVDLKKGDQIAYLSSGALLLTKDRQNGIPTKRLEAFLHLGIHGSDTEMRGSADIEVVKELEEGQFDLQWCSLKCMREWWNDLFQELERQVSDSWKPDTRTDEQKALDDQLDLIALDERLAAGQKPLPPNLRAGTILKPLEALLPKRADRTIQ